MAEPVTPYQLGLFGHPVKHSQSPGIHQGFATQYGIELDYQLIDASPDELPTRFKDWIKTAHGCNVTVPHKTDIMPLLDHYTEKAHLCQAVNTVFWQDGELWGDNTDGDGLILDLVSKGIELAGKEILIIGAGGAVKGIIPSLLEQGVMSISIKNRNVEKAAALASNFKRCSTAGLKTSLDFDLIIHATSMGHQGLSPDLKDHWFYEKTIAYDLSYGQAAEPFLAAAKACGAKQTFDGLGMLYGQAALAFERWFGKRPEINLPPK
ncbi:shikimate dehydrogenase [Marinicella sediminis]|uniref:Shikimate dehydrogenase (NADP(+)) n=1 Tax=Marinicella sediminis TaxID=1792834 RepID=A0ABV7JDN8_9GAMM|nr:shikimate dehydrogenase [Marinicella sediminis]